MAKTIASTYQPRWFQNRRLILGALAAIGIALSVNTKLGYPVTLSLILATQITLFVLLFHRPIWAMAALIIGQLTLNNFMLPLGGLQISVRFLWTILALLLLVPILRKKGGIRLGSGARRIIIPAVIFFCWATIANAVNTDLSYTVQHLRMNATALVLLILLPATVKNERDLKQLALVALITLSVSAIVALQQRFQVLGLPAYALYNIYDGSLSGYRVSGLSESSVQLGFNLPMVLLPVVALYFLKGVNLRFRKLLILLAIIMTAALFFTLTRSGVYSLAPGLLFIVLLMKGKPKKELFLVMLLLGTVFLSYVGMIGGRYSQGFSDEGSAAGRLVLWQAGLNVALDNSILGIGANRFAEVSLAYASTVSSKLKETHRAGRALGRYEAHNDFITVWASFGMVALLSYLWLLVGVFRNFADAYRHSHTRFLKGFAVGCFGAVAAYIVNAATHNVMDTSMLMWILGGLSIAATKIALSQRLSTVKEIR